VTFKSGTHLGAYEIIAALGKGGMGEVYRAVDVKASPAGFEVNAPKALFDAPLDVASPLNTNRYDVSADGQRFLINAPSENTSAGYLTVVVNWLADQRK
jgi:serine/threonine protein kinase